MKARKLIVVLLSLMVVLGTFVVGCGSKKDSSNQQSGSNSSKPTYVWKFAHEETPGDVQDLYAKKFKEILEKKSGGKIQIQIFPVGQLGDATQQAELLQNGGIQFACVSPGNTGTMVPENQLFSLQFLFPDDPQKVKEILTQSKALNQDLTALYEKKDIKVLSYWPEGWMQWTSNKPLNTPADFKGFKMRTMPSPMIVAAYEAYGANPTPVPYMEVYSGLQLHMIEGQENPLFAINTMKFYEVQKYLTLANASMYVTTTATNPKFFNSLPQDIQQDILDTVKECNDYAFDMQQDLNDKALEDIKSKSKIQINTLTPEQRAAFKTAEQAAYTKYGQMVGAQGQAILQKLQQEIDALK